MKAADTGFFGTGINCLGKWYSFVFLLFSGIKKSRG